MKKKLRAAGICAATLLALAPVFTVNPDVVHADVVNKDANKGTKSESNSASAKIEVPSLEVKSGTPNFTPATKITDVKLTGFGEGFTVNKLAPVVNIYEKRTDASDAIKNDKVDATKTVKSSDELQNDTDYYEVAEVVINTPEANAKYNIDNGVQSKEYTSDSNATVTVPIIQKITAKNNLISGQPFFADSQNNAYQNNQTINASETIKDSNDTTGASVVAPTSVKNIQTIINGMGIKAYKGSSSNENVFSNVSENDITEQLKRANITPDKDGNVTIPTSGFTYTLTVMNPNDDKTATLNIFFKGAESNYNAYPLIKFGKLNVMQGSNNFNQNPVAIVSLRDKNWKDNVIKQFTAQESESNNTKIDLTEADLTVTDMDIDHTGLYPATLKVANKDGKSTYLVFNIGVQGSKKDETVTRTVINSNDESMTSVPVYKIENGKATAIKEKTLKTNTQAVVYNDTQTIGKTKYTRVFDAKQEREKTNEWIKSEDLTDTPKKAEEQGTVKKLMHAAYLYNAKGKRVGKTILKSYSYVPVIYNKVKIGKHEYYRVANSKNFIRIGNIDAAYHELKTNAYIFNNEGRNVTSKKLVKTVPTYKTVKGKRVKTNKKVYQKLKLYYQAKADDKDGKLKYVKTYGSRFKIKGKYYYRVGYNRYVLAKDLKPAVKKTVKENTTASQPTNPSNEKQEVNK